METAYQKRNGHVPIEMKNGMRALLDMHNDDETQSSGVMGMHISAPRPGASRRFYYALEPWRAVPNV